MSKKHRMVVSFKYAINGIKLGIRNEPNLRIHFLAAFLAILVGIVLKLNPTELSVLSLTIGLVIILELFNTMLEALVDLVSPEIQPKAKIAKDVSASAVLVSAVMSVAVGLFLFVPRIVEVTKKGW